jgi:hypothetical protein
VANWPGYMREYMRLTREIDPDQFLFLHAGGGSGNGAATSATAAFDSSARDTAGAGPDGAEAVGADGTATAVGTSGTDSPESGPVDA